MIDISELLPSDMTLDQIPRDHQMNLLAFHRSLQTFRRKCGLIMICTSGYRTTTDHLEIYQKVNREREAAGLKALPIPWGSQHLLGHAADFLDPERKLAKFVEENETFVRKLGFHFEAKAATNWPTPWLHIQDVPPRSGNLWFQP